MANSLNPSRKEAFLHAFVNKGTAYTLEERKRLGLVGQLPPVVHTLDEQIEWCIQMLQRRPRAIDKYEWLMQLLATNTTLFYAAAFKHISEIMPFVYTPTVGEACQSFGLVCPEPRGLYITLNDADSMVQILKNWPVKKIQVIVVTDGERILGLGDLGTYGMGIPIGKLALYTALAGVNPEGCLPITLDVGTNNQKLLADKMYTGLRQKRITGDEYDKFLDKFMKAVVESYGSEVLIQFEDFGNHNAFRLLETYRDKYLCFNDDIQGTASVTLAGILSALRITEVPLKDNVFLLLGAGEASLGIAKLLISAMVRNCGITQAEAISKIYLIDSRGLLVKNRPNEHNILSGEKLMFIKDNMTPEKDLDKIIERLKPTMLIGAASQPGAFTAKVLSSMAKFNQRPVVFALSNPTSQAECTAEEAYKATEGRVVFATGSPFAPVTYAGKTYHTTQCNNAYIFPAMGLACIAGKLKTVPDDLFLIAADELAGMATKEDLSVGKLFPEWHKIREVSFKIAEAILREASKMNLCREMPASKNVADLLTPNIYQPHY